MVPHRIFVNHNGAYISAENVIDHKQWADYRTVRRLSRRRTVPHWVIGKTHKARSWEDRVLLVYWPFITGKILIDKRIGSQIRPRLLQGLDHTKDQTVFCVWPYLLMDARYPRMPAGKEMDIAWADMVVHKWIHTLKDIFNMNVWSGRGVPVFLL